MTKCKTPSSVFFLLGVLFLTACSGMPRIIAVDTARFPETLKHCGTVFPGGRWQFAHAIEADLPGGRRSQLIGVTEVSSHTGRVHAVMMTIEGLVLFDGLEDGQLTVNRGVAPFDSRAFARGLMEDIRLMFLKPGGQPMDAGITDDGFEICRYPVSGDSVVDVLVHPDGMFEIRKYKEQRLSRKAGARLNGGSIPEEIVFTACDPSGYRLKLRLISAEQITD